MQDIQIATEKFYNKKNIREHLEREIDIEPEILECLEEAVIEIKEWIQEDYYESKNIRLKAFMKHTSIFKISKLLRSIMIQVLAQETDTLFSAMVGKCAPMIHGLEPVDAAITMGEILTLMCDADLFDLEQAERKVTDENGFEVITTSYYVCNLWELTKDTQTFIDQTRYLPPMIVEPMKLRGNRDSGYLDTETETLILGKGNHHNEDICLDSLNRFNQIPLALNEEMLAMSLEKTKEISAKHKKQYKRFREESQHVFEYLMDQGNRFYLPHKVDKRGRTYAQGYHCTTQGDELHKALIELADKEVVTGEL